MELAVATSSMRPQEERVGEADGRGKTEEKCDEEKDSFERKWLNAN